MYSVVYVHLNSIAVYYYRSRSTYLGTWKLVLLVPDNKLWLNSVCFVSI